MKTHFTHVVFTLKCELLIWLMNGSGSAVTILSSILVADDADRSRTSLWRVTNAAKGFLDSVCLNPDEETFWSFRAALCWTCTEPDSTCACFSPLFLSSAASLLAPHGGALAQQPEILGAAGRKMTGVRPKPVWNITVEQIEGFFFISCSASQSCCDSASGMLQRGFLFVKAKNRHFPFLWPQNDPQNSVSVFAEQSVLLPGVGGRAWWAERGVRRRISVPAED